MAEFKEARKQVDLSDPVAVQARDDEIRAEVLADPENFGKGFKNASIDYMNRCVDEGLYTNEDFGYFTHRVVKVVYKPKEEIYTVPLKLDLNNESVVSAWTVDCGRLKISFVDTTKPDLEILPSYQSPDEKYPDAKTLKDNGPDFKEYREVCEKANINGYDVGEMEPEPDITP